MNTIDKLKSVTNPTVTSQFEESSIQNTVDSTKQFSMHFAPHLGLLSPDKGMFRHHAGDNPVHQIGFMAQKGFTAMEDNWMAIRSVDTQLAVGKALKDKGMRMGVIVNTMKYAEPTFVLNTKLERERLMQEVRDTAKVAKRVGATHVTTLSGTAHPSMHRDYQTANMIENLKWAGDVAAKEDLVLAVEPINHKGWPGTFLTEIAHGYQIAKAVDMPSVKLLYDFWHQQIHGGDLIENLDAAYDQIGYFQIADNPGRVEPGIGEINYAPIIKRIKDKGFTGIIGMEFDNAFDGIDGEIAVIEAMRAIDPAATTSSKLTK
jgi:hydroxypyruvate isomerase